MPYVLQLPKYAVHAVAMHRGGYSVDTIMTCSKSCEVLHYVRDVKFQMTVGSCCEDLALDGNNKKK